MKKVFILHLLPLEYYPPITNLIEVLSKDSALQIEVFSTKNNKNRPVYDSKNSTIYRSKYPAYVKNSILKVWAYLCYIILPVWRLFWFKPDVLMYYEPHSAMPAYVYKKIFNSKVRLFIHYHEYYEPDNFKGKSMAAVRFFHKLEIAFLYKKAEWISQTNSSRLNFFLNDYPFIQPEKLNVLANYPSKEWKTLLSKPKESTKLKLIYIGALSFENTFIKEVVNFVIDHPDKFTLTIYSYNCHDNVKAYLKSQNPVLINFISQGISYDKIPIIASQFNIGLILYKGHNLNYTFNAPNKLFEYIACNLEVWFPRELKGCLPYINTISKPIIKAINFEELSSDLIKEYKANKNFPNRKIAYFYEEEIKTLLQTMKKKESH